MTISRTYTFATGQTILAAQVNQNFADVGDNALNRTGDTITGNISVNSGVTIDGIDLSADVAKKGGTETISGSWTFSNALVLPTSASPTQTAEGSVVWNSSGDVLTVGTGAARKTMVDLDSTQTLTGAKTFSAATSFGSTVAVASTAANAIDVAGGITAGTGNVGIVDTTGKIPALSSTYLASLSGANLTLLNASNLGSGTVPTARLGSGTANSTTFLRGDSTWATVGVKSIQQGTLTISNGASSGTAAITAVTTSKAFVVYNGWSMVAGDTLDEVREVGFRVELTSSTVVTGRCGHATHGDVTVAFTVVEFF